MAGRLPQAWLDELRDRADIVQVVSRYVQLNPKGSRYWGLCPFHGEKTPSFSVNPQRQMYYCFGCHAGGSAITFVMEMEHLDFMEAVKLLAEQVHMEVPELTHSREEPAEAEDAPTDDDFEIVVADEAPKAEEAPKAPEAPAEAAPAEEAPKTEE